MINLLIKLRSLACRYGLGGSAAPTTMAHAFDRVRERGEVALG